MRSVFKMMALLLCISVFSSCSGGNGDSSGEIEYKPSITVGESEILKKFNEGFWAGDSELLGNLPMPERELENKEIRFVSWSGTLEDYRAGDARTPVSPVEIAIQKYGAKITVDVIPFEEYYNQLTARIQSGKAPDGFHVNVSNFFPNAISSNLIEPLDSYIDFNSHLWDEVRDCIEMLKWKDGRYYFAVTNKYISSLFYANRKLFREAGLPTPQELYERGEWTMDAMKEAAIKLTKKNDSGVTTQYGLQFTSTDIITATGINMIDFNPSVGDYTFNLRSSKYAEVMNLLYDLGKGGQNVIGGSANDFLRGKTAMFIGPGWYANVDFNSIRLRGDLDWVPLPKMDKDSKHYISASFDPGFAILRGAKNPEGIALLNELWRWTLVGVQGNRAYHKVYPPEAEELPDGFMTKEETARMINIIQTTPAIINNLWVSWLGTSDYGITQVIEGKNWSTVLEEKAPEFERRIQDFLK